MKIPNRAQVTEVFVTTAIIIQIILQLELQGLQVSSKANTLFFIAEGLTIILTLITVGLFEACNIKKSIRLTSSVLLLFAFSLCIFFIMHSFYNVQLWLLVSIIGSVLLKILNSYRNFDFFKQNIFKHSIALLYSMLGTSLIAMYVYEFHDNYVEVLPLAWALLYFIYIGYLLPFKYNEISSLN